MSNVQFINTGFYFFLNDLGDLTVCTVFAG